MARMKTIITTLVGLAWFGLQSRAQNPTLGAHALAAYWYGQSTNSTISTPAMTTQMSGSTMLVCLSGDVNAAFTGAPTDNKGNTPYVQLGAMHRYTLYGGYGTALYAFSPAGGGRGHVITTSTTYPQEVTLSAVEIKNGGVIEDFKWNEVLKGNPLTSLTVTTTGPATLIAFWWGDGDGSFAHTAIPNNGFTVIDSLLPPGSLIQTAVATKDVPVAGTYDVTWDSAGEQGAQLWLVAVQKSPTIPAGALMDGFLTLTYKKIKAATGLTYAAEVARSVTGPWSSAAKDVEQLWRVLDGPTTQTITARDKTSLSNAPMRFMRLKVEVSQP